MAGSRFYTPCITGCRFKLTGSVGQDLGCANKIRDLCPVCNGEVSTEGLFIALWRDDEVEQFKEGLYFQDLINSRFLLDDNEIEKMARAWAVEALKTVRGLV